MMQRKELAALIFLVFILVGFPVGIFAYQGIYLPASFEGIKVIDLVARVPEAGGWSPEIITVNRGDRVRLRITSPDVVHGFAVGKMGIDVGQIVPGKVTTVDFVASEMGRFTFYCNVWCDPAHYRMRGILEVVDPDNPNVPLTSSEQPGAVFESLDIDAPHEAEVYPAGKPSALRGQTLAAQLSLPELADLHSQSPAAAFQTIRQDVAADALSEAAIWDLVAYLWSRNTTRERLDVGAALYAKNCVGCHGASGQGNGPGSQGLDHETVDFTAARSMAGGTSDIYYAKVRRGGMGTGMPYFGTIFTEEETWSIVDFLWTFLFESHP